MSARFNAVLTDQQYAWLERLAAKAGVSMGEMLRRILDEVRERSK